MPQKDFNPVKELKELLAVLLPPENIYLPVVRKEQQLKLLETLNETLSTESFYFVFNLLTCELEDVKNATIVLGYPDHEFTVNRYLHCTHPGQTIQFNMIAHCMYKILCRGIFKLQFSTQKYISLIALKHYNGEYIVFKKTTSVFQYDTKDRLLAQLNEFNKIGDYEAEPLRPRVTETSGSQKDEFERQVFQMVLKGFMEKKYFSEKEFEVLKYYAGNESINRKQLAQLLGVTVSTIDTFNKRILVKARNTFTHLFNDVRAVAFYLKKEKIL
jgi:hypothetical protein